MKHNSVFIPRRWIFSTSRWIFSTDFQKPSCREKSNLKKSWICQFIKNKNEDLWNNSKKYGRNGFHPKPTTMQSSAIEFSSNLWCFYMFHGCNVLGFYILNEVDTIEECMDTIFALIVVVGITLAYISIICKNDKLFNMIKFTAEEATFSKCNSIFIFL